MKKPKLHRIYLPGAELKKYEAEHPDDIWYDVHFALELKKLKAPKGVTIWRSNPYWNPGVNKRNAKWRGLWLTIEINK